MENSNFTQRPSDDVDKGSHRNLYCSVLSGVLIAVGVYRLTSDVWTASILGVGIWWVVYTISVGMISIVNSVDAMKKTQLEIVELLKETKRDRENHR
ncbi:MAG: hypothetical protein Q7S52_03840 [bacterium]|nr:hypothetical protein [bacterium]